MFKSLPLVAGICYSSTHWFLRRFAGTENLPPRGTPAIIAANHCSLLDGITLCTEYCWNTLRPLHPLVTADAFVNPLFGWILRTTKAVSIDRTDPEDTVIALRTLLGYLARGEAIGIFPEGHLNNGQSMRLPRPGMALLALESGAAIWPCGLRGTAEAFPPDGHPRFKRCVEIHLGKPIPTAELSRRYHSSSAAERKKLIADLSYQTMTEIAALSGLSLHRRMTRP